MEAIRVLVIGTGGDGEAYTDALRTLDDDLFEGVIFGWEDTISKSTIYSFLREGNYVGYGTKDQQFGHSQDGSEETLATFLNLALSYPDKFGVDLHYYMTDEERAAVLDIIQVAIHTIKNNHPDDIELATWLDTRYSAFASVLTR